MKITFSQFATINGYKWVRASAVLAAFIHFLVVLIVVISRINYRFELEWMEGASLVQVYRVISSQDLYLQPSLEYIPLIYPPLYFYLAALLVKIIGLSFLPLQLLSFASTIGCLVFIYLAVKDKTNSVICGIIATGSFTTTFMLGGAWFDIARVDMLFIFLCLAGVYFLGKQTIKNSIIAGLLFCLSFLTKQTALPIFLVCAGSTFLLFRKQTVPFVFSFAIPSLIIYFLLNVSSQGWYQYYILALPASHQIKWSSLISTLQSGFVTILIIILVGVSPIIFGISNFLKDRMHLYYTFAVLGLLATSILARINRGAYINTLVPAYAGLSILFGLGINWLITNFKLKWISMNVFQIILWLLVTVQFALLGYNPLPQIPTLADRKAGDAFVSELQGVQGNVLIPYHNYLALFADKKPFFHMVTFDEIRGRYSKKQAELKAILKEFHDASFSLFIMDLPDNLIQNNRCVGTQNIKYESSRTFVPVTGYSVRPTIQYSDCP